MFSPLEKKYKMKRFFAFLLMAAVIFPAVAFADADKIFRENKGAVVVVVIYNEKNEQVSQGSGFVLRSDGIIVTNYHVITDTGDIKIKAGANILSVDGVVFADKDNDIIILKAKAEKMQTVKTGDAGKVTVGEKIYVISSPQGLENTISDGIISGIREITPGKKMLQISAPISPGSSGGPVFNNDGEVIGIATFIINKAQNINFATPINVIGNTITDRKITKLKDSGIEDPKKIWGYWFHVGLTNSNSGKWEEAMKAFKEAIKIQPDTAAGHTSLGIAYQSLGMYKEAVDAYKQSIRLKSDDAVVYYNLGLAYDKLGRPQDAFAAYKQAVKLNPNDGSAQISLAEAYVKAGMFKDAIETYKQYTRINPDSAAPYFHLGSAYNSIGSYQEAAESFKQAVKIEPNNAFFHFYLGTAYDKLGMYKEGIEAYKNAVKIKHELEYAHYNLGVDYLAVDDRNSALEEFKILKGINAELANKLFNLIYK